MGRRPLLAAFLLLLSACGAQELYQPPTAPFQVVGRLALPSDVEDVDVLGGYAFAAGGQAGLHVIDITDPSRPALVLTLDTVKYAESVRVASTGFAGGVVDVAFVVEGTEGITTYDITDPPHAYSFLQGTTAVDGKGLFIDLPDDPAEPYIVYLAESWKGVRIFESDPSTPGLLLYKGVFASTRGYAEAVTVHDGYAYVADDEMGVAVLDVRTRALGVVGVVSSCDTDGNALGIDSDGDYLYVADDENGLTVLEIRREGTPELPVPHVVGHLSLSGDCRAIRVRDGIAFLAAEDGGVHFVDVSDPSSPVSLGTVLTSYATGISLSEEGLVVVSDRDEGILVLDGETDFLDLVPPAAVRDLSAVAVDSTTVRLSWSAPGDDGLSGTASLYDIRFALSPIDSLAQWEEAGQAEGEPSPSPRGGAETFDVTGLLSGEHYHFALRTADEALNWSGLSNAASATTPTGNVPPTLRAGSVSPEGGTAESTYVFQVTYEDGDANAPVEAKVSIGDALYEMAYAGGEYDEGALYRYEASLPVGVYSYFFRFSDGKNDPVFTAPVEGPYVGETYFLMGSPADEEGRDADETLHPVVFLYTFQMSDHEVTQSEFESIMGVNPSRFTGADLPVENVTWYDAVAYCNARSLAEGLTPAYTVSGESVEWDRDAEGYRLPTEAEWEAACRAGSGEAFSGGAITELACGVDPVLDLLGWYCGNAGAGTHEVGGKDPNGWGLHDMHGNVWEWCWDWYTADPGSGIAADPEGPGGGSQRVVRGGSWYYYARDCRSASRAPYWPNSADDIVGFRVVRTTR